MCVLEVALIAPWIFFLFVGALDMGYYSYALISTENAARVACEYTSKSSTTAADSSAACTYALDELKAIDNARSLSSCDSSPLVVSATKVTGADGVTDGDSLVSVAYTTDQFVPLPVLNGKFTITRTVQMKVRQ